MKYAVTLTPDEGTFLVTCPDLPEVTTFGEDKEEALFHAVDAIETAIQGRMTDGTDVPPPGHRGEHSVTLPAQTAAKVLLYRAMRAHHVRKSELARRLNWHAPQVDRLLDLSHSSRLDQMEAALRALGMELEVSAREA